jgi:hypothetical protein
LPTKWALGIRTCGVAEMTRGEEPNVSGPLACGLRRRGDIRAIEATEVINHREIRILTNENLRELTSPGDVADSEHSVFYGCCLLETHIKGGMFA